MIWADRGPGPRASFSALSTAQDSSEVMNMLMDCNGDYMAHFDNFVFTSEHEVDGDFTHAVHH